MPFGYNSTGVKPSQFSDPVPDGEYILQILKTEEQESRSGNPMVKVTCSVDSPANFAGAVMFHYVTFIGKGLPGAGIALHFLKSIGEPHEESDSLEVDPKKWEMKKFKAKVIQEPYSTPDGKKGVSNKIKGVDVISKDDIQF